jgi:hypothetical protein
MRWLFVLLVGCAGSDARWLAELRHHHARALSLATRDDDQPRQYAARMKRESVQPLQQPTDPRVPADLPPSVR